MERGCKRSFPPEKPTQHNKRVMLKEEMKSMKNKWQPVVGLILLALIVWGIYLALTKIWVVFSSVDPKLSAGMLAASATVIVFVISIILSKRQEQKVAIENELRVKKTPVYEGIINFIFRITFAEKLGKKQPTEKEMVEFFSNTTRDLVVWGSHDMIKAFAKFRVDIATLYENSKDDPFAILRSVEDLLIAIRKDLGHKHKNIKRGEILRLYITDLPENFKKTNITRRFTPLRYASLELAEARR